MDQMEMIIYNEQTNSRNDSILSKYDDFLAHTSDIKRVNEKLTADCEKFIENYNESSLQMEALSKSLQQREHELEKQQQKLLKEKRHLELRDRMLHCKQEVNNCYSSSKAGEALKKELDMLHKRRAELEDQLKPESFESLQSEIKQLEVSLQFFQFDECVDFQEKFKNLQRELVKKDKKLQELKGRTNSFRSEIEGKDLELEDVRRELIKGLKTYPSGGVIGIKQFGLVESKPFFVGCKSRAKTKEMETKFKSLCAQLDKNRNWHPFKAITDESGKREIIDEEDEKMVKLKGEYSEEEYGAIVEALMERNRYHKSGRELWNYKEKREASLKEGIDYILQEWKIRKQWKRR